MCFAYVPLAYAHHLICLHLFSNTTEQSIGGFDRISETFLFASCADVLRTNPGRTPFLDSVITDVNLHTAIQSRPNEDPADFTHSLSLSATNRSFALSLISGNWNPTLLKLLFPGANRSALSLRYIKTEEVEPRVSAFQTSQHCGCPNSLYL